MSYNHYWSGEMSIEPPLTDEQVEQLREWLHIDGDNVIEDDILDRWFAADSILKYRTPYCPFDDIENTEWTSPVANPGPEDRHSGTLFTMCDDGTWPEAIAAILARLTMIVAVEMGHPDGIEGDFSWDGEETEDLGYVRVRGQQVWMCPVQVIWPMPGDEGTTLWTPPKEA